MREAAYTSVAGNALSVGLVSHFCALVAGMMNVSGALDFACAAYGFACLAFVAGAYLELKDRGYAPFTSPGFYGASAVAAAPVVGPFAALFLLYAMQGNRGGGPVTAGGMLGSIPRLRVNPLVLFIFLAILFILFATRTMQRDPYFKKPSDRRVSLIERTGHQEYQVERTGIMTEKQ